MLSWNRSFDRSGGGVCRRIATASLATATLAVALLAARPVAAAECLLTAEQELSTPAGVGADQGAAVAIDGDVAVVASRDEGPGSVDVYRRVDGAWTLEQTLSPAGGQDDLDFGTSVAVDGDTIFVGAPGDALFAGGHVVYVYERRDGTWQEVQQLEEVVGFGESLFGAAVAVQGNLALVGAPGSFQDSTASVFAYLYDGGQWREIEEIFRADGGPFDDTRFGDALAIDGTRAIIGDSRNELAYVHRFTGIRWVREQRLEPLDSDGFSLFPVSVAIDGDLALLGNQAHNHDGVLDSGAAYLFQRSGGVWSEQTEFVGNLEVRGRAGYSVGLSGERVIVGGTGGAGNPNSPDSGSVFVYQRVRGEWIEQLRVLSSNPGAFDFFGSALAVDGEHLVVGADRQDSTGSAHAITLPEIGLEVTPSTVVTGEEVTFRACAGSADDPVRLSLVAIDGAPVADVLARSSFDEAGQWERTVEVPPIAAGHTLTLEAFGVAGSNLPEFSNRAELIVE